MSARPAAKMFLAALTFRSCTVPHAAHAHCRTLSGLGPSLTTHAEHTWLVGSNWPILANVRPYWAAFSPSAAAAAPSRHRGHLVSALHVHLVVGTTYQAAYGPGLTNGPFR